MARRGEPNPALYQAVLDAPDDDGPRLAYADWLEKHRHPERARFIRLQCRQARLSRIDPAYHRLEDEIATLRQRFRKAWLVDHVGTAHVCSGFLRGFPEQVGFLSVKAFRELDTDVLRRWVRRVSFAGAQSLGGLASSKKLAHVRELDLSDNLLGDDALRTLLASP